MTVGLLIITAPKGAWTFVRGSKWGAMLNVAVCGYLLLTHVLGQSRGGVDGDEGGAGVSAGNHVLVACGYVCLLMLAAPGLLSIFR